MDLPSIVSVNEAFYPHEGGSEKRSYEILTRLSKKGFDIKVLTNPFPRKTEIKGIDIEYVTSMDERKYFNSSSRRIRGVLEFGKACRDAVKRNGEYDIFNFDEFPLYHGIKAVSSIPDGKRSFFMWHEVLKELYNERGGLWRIASMWEKKITKVFTDHVAVSNTVAQMLNEKYGLSHVSVVENGVDTKAFGSNLGKKTWGKIIYVGRIEPHKQLDLLINAFKNMSEFQLNIIGGGSQLDYLKTRVNGTSNIKFLGHVDNEELLREVRDSWLFVMPSNREGFSIASLEAMASSIPVVTVGGHYNLAANEIIKNGYNGLVSPNFDQMMAEIRNLYINEDSWKLLSNNAREFSRDFDWDAIADRMARIYTQN
ncbi:MAG: glycosyltransferase family 4 protein [Thermoplasmataceae archaeon]